LKILEIFFSILLDSSAGKKYNTFWEYYISLPVLGHRHCNRKKFIKDVRQELVWLGHTNPIGQNNLKNLTYHKLKELDGPSPPNLHRVK